MVNGLNRSVFASSLTEMSSSYPKIANKFLELLIHSKINNEWVDIGIQTLKRKKSSMICYNVFKGEEKQLTLRLESDLSFTLELYIYDDDNNKYKHYYYKLTEEDIKIIPVGLVPLMKEALRDQKTKVVEAKTLEYIQ